MRFTSLAEAVFTKQGDEAIWQEVCALADLLFNRPQNPPFPPQLVGEAVLRDAFWQEDRSLNNEASRKVYSKIQEYYAEDARRRKGKDVDEKCCPCTTLIGPSGVGKSFAVKELAARHGQYVAYINVSDRSATSSYPRRSALADYIEENLEEEIHHGRSKERGEYSRADVAKWMDVWQEFIGAMYWDAIACYRSNVGPGEHFRLQVDSPEYGRELLEDFLEVYRDKSRGYQELDDPATVAFLERRIQRLSSGNKGDDRPKLEPNTSIDRSGPKLIFCLDSAVSMLEFKSSFYSPYLYYETVSVLSLGSSIAGMDSLCVFGLLVDKHPKIADAAVDFDLLDGDWDPEEEPSLQFDPICYHGPFDAYASPEYKGLNNDDPISMREMLKLGRPLWGALLERRDEGAADLMSKVLDMVAYKMQMVENNGQFFEKTERDLDLIAHRIGFHITSYHLSEQLVADCLRYVAYIDPEVEEIFTLSLSEPILGFAAGWQMKRQDQKRSMFEAFTSSLMEDTIEVEDVCSLIGAILLLFCIDSTQPWDVGPKVIKVSQFFRTILGEEGCSRIAAQLASNNNNNNTTTTTTTTAAPANNESLNDVWENGNIYFSHIFRPTGAHDCARYPKRFIREAYRRGAGLFFPGSFGNGNVIGIPILTKNNGYSLVFIQVKASADAPLSTSNKRGAATSIEQAFHKVEDLDAPCFGVVIGLELDKSSEIDFLRPSGPSDPAAPASNLFTFAVCLDIRASFTPFIGSALLEAEEDGTDWFAEILGGVYSGPDKGSDSDECPKEVEWDAVTWRSKRDDDQEVHNKEGVK